MKRILLFNDGLGLGGTEILLIQILEHLVTTDCDVTLLLPCHLPENVLLDRVPSSVRIKYIYKKPPFWLKKKIDENILIFYPRFYNWLKGIRQTDFDVIVCFKECFYAKAFSVLKIRRVLWIHNILYKRTYDPKNFKDRLTTWLNKKHISNVQHSYLKFNQIICVSEACKDAYVNIVCGGNGALAKNLNVIYNSIDLLDIREKAKAEINDLPQDRTNFIFLTRLSPEKRNDRLIYAAQKLSEEGYNFHIYILGDGVETAFTSLLDSDRLLSEKLSFFGRVDNPYPYLLQAKWALCVSERESFGLTLLEAMALDTPVITTDCGGPTNIVENGRYGLLVDNSAEGVYQGMKAVLDDSSLSIKYSSDLRNAVRRFDYQHWLAKVDSLFGL